MKFKHELTGALPGDFAHRATRAVYLDAHLHIVVGSWVSLNRSCGIVITEGHRRPVMGLHLITRDSNHELQRLSPTIMCKHGTGAFMIDHVKESLAPEDDRRGPAITERLDRLWADTAGRFSDVYVLVYWGIEEKYSSTWAPVNAAVVTAASYQEGLKREQV